MKEVGYGCASGKVILLGEHAVVHGYPATAVGLENGVEAHAVFTSGPVSVACDDWQLRACVADETVHGGALADLLRSAGLPVENAAVRLVPRIPARAGLGASAAMAVAVLRSVSDLFNVSLSDEQLFVAAQSFEKAYHETPSGLDASMAIFGGAARFSRKDGISKIPATKLRLLVVHSGAPKDTARSVRRFAARMSAETVEAKKRLERIGEIVEQGISALSSGDVAALGALMVENHEHLRWFDVSTDALDRIVEIALHEGALGAKLTGGGGGGCAAVLLPLEGDEVERALSTAGFAKVSL